MKIANNALELIGNTPVVKINKLADPNGADVYLKLESQNIAGSVKDRAALAMIEGAEKEGLIKPGETTLLDSTSGNTGIGYALVAALKGYRLVIIMNEKASVERRALMKAYGAELILVPPSEKGIQGDFEIEEKIAKEKGYFPLWQFENKWNSYAHKTTTGPEIYAQLDGAPDVFVACVGTSGTFTGTTEFLKEKDPNVHAVAVEPAGSAILSGGKPGPHKIAGIGPGIIPGILKRELIDEVYDVTDEQAIDTVRQLALQEGLFLGYSSGAAAFAALEIAKKLEKGKKVIAIAPDGGSRYLSQWS